MLHVGLISPWSFAGAALVTIVAIVGIVVLLRFDRVGRERRQRERSAERRRKNIAYQRAWDWIMRRPRNLRLTDERSSRD